MKRHTHLLRWLICSALLWLHAVAAADCVEPDDRLSIPDGATASNEAMMSARDAVSLYSEQAQLFLQCLDEQESQIEGVTEERKALILQYNRVVNRIKELAANFNDQLAVYSAQQAGSDSESSSQN